MTDIDKFDRINTIMEEKDKQIEDLKAQLEGTKDHTSLQNQLSLARENSIKLQKQLDKITEENTKLKEASKKKTQKRGFRTED